MCRVARSAPGVACALGLSISLGCAPTINVLGVYFPPWLVSGVLGLVAAYTIVGWMGRRPGARVLAQSGLLFCSLTVIVSLLIWWIFFSRF
jgi:amino acid transporter